MKALTAAEMREVDRLTTERYGVPGLDLMENAGKHVANFVRMVAARWRLGRPQRVAVLCGKGNNGGDGLVVARLLAKDQASFDVRAVLLGDAKEMQGDAATNYQRWVDSGGKVVTVESQQTWEEQARPLVAGADFVIDALFGTGLRKGASGLAAQIISDLNTISKNATAPTPAMIVAVDMPSGLPSDGESADGPVVHAHATITFTAPKMGQLVSKDAECCGELHVKGIGSPRKLVEETGQVSIRWAGPDEFASMPLVRAAGSHKGTYGHVLVIGGSVGKSGAAALAGYGSLCGGAGLTTVACPDVVQPIVAAAHSEYMTESLDTTKEGTIAISNHATGRIGRAQEGKDVLAIGPGLGTRTETQELVRRIVRESSVPVILDADGLNAFAGKADLLRDRKNQFLALTPHPGEISRLIGKTTPEVQADRLKFASNTAHELNAHVVLKGFHTVIAAPDGRTWVNTTGGPALAKGGSGDVLTGLLAALTAQFGTQDWVRVLALGTYLHGEAGNHGAHLSDVSGELASHVASSIPIARRALLQEIRFDGIG